ncbi:hypothetical protein NPIL_91571 [Nephila pilipes]|uniref:Uncharacterized protein n=1 Tax=Nephila pilipes TaxID=299642 RepID=A0A8X6NV99_NEPPI|nr:hypothetical protein NPIL_91571 [Nephila pilipes]
MKKKIQCRKNPIKVNSLSTPRVVPIPQAGKIVAPPTIRGKKLFCGRGNTQGSRGGSLRHDVRIPYLRAYYLRPGVRR